jgi:site-specific DNA-methyltransferase (adenine-specific)/modification methylase
MGDPWKRKETIGDTTLYLGDCLEILPTLGRVDAVVTDPPYGIQADRKQAARAGKRSRNALCASRDYGQSDWDNAPASRWLLDWLREISTYQVFFGGNYFELPPARCWLVWDKHTGANNYADCELAWTNLDKPIRKIDWLWKGMFRKGDDIREHPTQKPLGVMEWIIDQLPDAQTILDPFMGSGTTGVACANLGRKFIGIEIEERYFNIACERIERAYQQLPLDFGKEIKTTPETPLLPGL